MRTFKELLITGFEASELDADYLARLRKLADKTVFLPSNSAELDKNLALADGLLVKFNPVSKETIDKAPNLKFIGVFGTGFGKIDTAHATSKGIVVSNIPGYSTEAVAEFVFGALLEHIRDLERAKVQARQENYSEVGFSPIEIKGKTFGVIGLGRIGSRVAKLALAFGANVVYWSRNRKEELEPYGIQYMELDKLIEKTDILSVHLSLNDQTRNILDAGRIKKLRKCILINTAPMELLDIDALEQGLEGGDLTVIIDHSDEMKVEDLKRLQKSGNCIVYPPVAYVTQEAKKAKQKILVDNTENFLNDKPTNTVN